MIDILDQIERRLLITDHELIQDAGNEIARLRALVEPDTTPLPPWLAKAREYLGMREIKGLEHNPLILRMWMAIRMSGIRDDETPWCAAFVGSCLEQTGYVSTRAGNARSYNKWGVELPGPAVGAIVTYWRGSRGSWKGHTNLVVGQDPEGNLLAIGGNQGDEVSIRAYPAKGDPGSRVLSYRFPKGYPVKPDYDLPVYATHALAGSET